MFLNKIKISHKIMIIIVTAAIMLVAFSIGAVVMGKQQIRTLKSIYIENVVPLDNIRTVQVIFKEIEYRMAAVHAEFVGAIQSGKNLEESMKEIDIKWNEVKVSLREIDLSDDAKKAMLKFEKGYNAFAATVAVKLKEAYLDNEPEKIEDLFNDYLDYKPLITRSINEFSEILKNNVKNHYVESQATISKINIVVAVTLGVTIVFFLVLAVFILHSINKPIIAVNQAAGDISKGDLTQTIKVKTEDEMGTMAKRLNVMVRYLRDSFGSIASSVRKMTSDIEGLSGLSKKLSEGAENQSTKGEQVAVASTEMSQTLLDVAQNISDASETTKASVEIATNGKNVVARTVEGIEMLAESVNEASETIHTLGGSLKEIDNTVSIIKEIADQTNLLALNAAIEAARSGEYGRGFAVVADEVRKLAEKTAKATEEIDAKIDAIQKESTASISIMENGKLKAKESVNNAAEAGEVLQNIVESCNTVMDMVQRVAAATEEQTAVSEEVSQSMEYISQITKENSTMSGEMQTAIFDLSNLAQGIMKEIMHFKTGNNVPSGETVSKPQNVYGNAEKLTEKV